MDKFREKHGEKQGQRRKRFLKFLRDMPMPNATWDEKLKRWVPKESEVKRAS